MDEYHEAERIKNIRAGTVAAMVMNAQRSSKDQKLWGWEDFFGTPKIQEPAPKTCHEKLIEMERYRIAVNQRKGHR